MRNYAHCGFAKRMHAPFHKFHQWMIDARLYSQDWRQRNEDHFDFYDGNQWNSEERATLNARGQQAVVLNIVRPTVDMICAQYAQRRTDINVLGRELSDDGLAYVLTHLLKQVYDQSDYSFYEGQLFREGVVGGMGWLEVGVREDDRGDNEIFCNQVPWNEMYWDPHFRRPDGSDARYIIRQKWMDRDQVTARWPHAVDQIESLFEAFVEDYKGQEYAAQTSTAGGSTTTSDHYDHKSRRVAVNECWYRDGKGALRYCIFTYSLFLQGGEEDSQNAPPYEGINDLPFVCYMASRNRKGEPQGVVEWIKEIQRTLNHTYSRWQWNVVSKQILAESDAADDWDQVRQAVRSPDGIALFAPGAIQSGKVMQLNNTAESAHLSNAWSFLLSMAQRTSGVNEAMMGMGGNNARSAQQESSRLLQGAQMQTSIIENLHFTKKRAARLILKLMGTYYTDERVLRVIAPNQETEKYILNEEFDGGKGIMEKYDVSEALKYDAVLQPVPAFDTFRQYMLTSVAEFAKAGAIPPQLASRLLIEYSNLPEKTRIIKEVDAYFAQQQALAQQQQQAETASTIQAASPDMSAAT